MRRKNPPKKNYSRTQQSHQVSWLLMGVIIGLLIAGIFYLKSHTKITPTITTSALTSEEDVPRKSLAARVQSQQKIKPKEKKSHKNNDSQYDFYNMLSNGEDTTIKRKSDFTTQKNSPKAQKYVVEMGTFKTFNEADQLKAQLVLMGFEVGITKNPKGNHRVIAGPFETVTEAKKIQNKLKDNGVKGSIVFK